MLYLGIDDTDTLGSRGTGSLARLIAADLARDYMIQGVVRHQLLLDDAIPYTAKNSCAALLIDTDEQHSDAIFAQVRQLMVANFIAGSDPALALAAHVPAEIMAFGQQVQQQVITQSQAQALADTHQIRLEGLGGTHDGKIGALAAVGLAASGDDGRYIQVGTIRDLKDLQPVTAVLDAGIERVQTLAGDVITSGYIHADKLRPARRQHRPILFVEANTDGIWHALKLD